MQKGITKMNRRDIQILRIYTGGPAITIIMPYDKEKIKKTFESLMSLADADDAILASMQGHFETLYEHLIPYKEARTVAIFVNKYAAYLFWLPFDMPEIAVCDTTFKLDDLVAKMNRERRYWIFDCTAEKMALLEGTNDFIMEVDKSCTQIDESGALFDRKGSINSLGDYLEQDPLPICLVGLPEDTLAITLDAPFRDHIVAHTPFLEDAPVVMRMYFENLVNRVLEDIKGPKPAVEYVNALRDIITAARQGQVKIVMFEKGYHLHACQEQVTQEVLLDLQECPLGYQKVSLIDQIIESVCSKGGQLFVVPGGTIEEYGRIVAILR